MPYAGFNDHGKPATAPAAKNTMIDQMTLFDAPQTDATPATPDFDLRPYAVILVNTSGGKDSQTSLAVVHALAVEQGVADRMVAVHADLGRVEWKGTRELAQAQADHYGVRFEAVKRPQGDLLDHIEARGMWPSSTTRYCTSDHKRGQCAKVVTMLTDEIRRTRFITRQIRILNIFGFRADESPARAKIAVFSRNARLTNSKRIVDDWLPIRDMTEAQVWQSIKASGVPHHPAYDLGMPRLSCVFCIFAPRPALILAGHHNRDLLDEYAAVEARIGHTFRQNTTMADIKAAVDNGEGQDVGNMSGAWNM